MKIKTSELTEYSFRDLKIIDLTDFKSLNMWPLITELQNYFHKNQYKIVIKNDYLQLPTNITLDNLNFDLIERNEIYLIIPRGKSLDKNYIIDNILVKYDENYEYGAFTDYNLDKDTIKSISEFEKTSKCLESDSDCNYVESYSFSIYLELSLKEYK